MELYSDRSHRANQEEGECMNLILGAGVSGLASGYKTGYPIYEATSNYGGICNSYMKEGFQFSVGGGHWLFENDKTKNAMELIKSLVELKSYDRLAGIYYNKIFPYPIQTFTQKPNTSQPGYFKEWLRERFSNPECNMFFYPFNEKYTAGLMDEIISYDSYKTPPAGSVGFVSRFHDPIGGLGCLMDKLASKCQINHNKRAINVNTEEKIVSFQDGESIQYDKLISTIPLNQMLYICNNKKYDLPYSSVFVLNIGATPGRNFPKEHWLYIPFCKTNFYRVGFYTNVDPSKAPEGKVGLSVEMAIPSDYDYEDLDVPFITSQVIEELQSWGWIEDVIVTDPTFVKCAYTWNRTLEERERHIQWLKERDIICIGRYAKWIFQGMMESIEQGLSL